MHFFLREYFIPLYSVWIKSQEHNIANEGDQRLDFRVLRSQYFIKVSLLSEENNDFCIFFITFRLIMRKKNI